MKTRYILALALGGLGLAMFAGGSYMVGSGPSCDGHLVPLNTLLNEHVVPEIYHLDTVDEITTTHRGDHTVDCEGTFRYHTAITLNHPERQALVGPVGTPYFSRWSYHVLRSDDGQSERVDAKQVQ